MAADTENVAEEIQQEEVVQPEVEQQAESQPTHNETLENAEKDKDYNFRQLREKSRQAEEERDFYRRQVEQLIQASQDSPSEAQETSTVSDDDLIEGRHYKALEAQIRELNKSFKLKELETVPERLQNRFSDFDAVVTKENVEKLKNAEPELYRSITAGEDLFAKGVSAYKTLKALGLAESKENYSKQKEFVQDNHKKPMSVQAIKGQGALHEANVFAQGLTPELKKQLQKEMAEAVKAR